MSKKVAIYTSATCAPCKVLKPVLIAAAAAHGFPLEVVEMAPDTQDRFRQAGVRAAPTVVCVEEGVEIGRFTGAKTPDALLMTLRSWGVAK